MDEGTGAILLLLGPVDVITLHGPESVVSPGKQRAILAYLALHAGTAVSSRRLVEAVWPSPAPATATAMVHTAIARIRAALAGQVALRTTPAGYVLDMDATLVDVGIVGRLRHDAQAAVDAGRDEEAATMLRAALELWRGESLADLTDEPFAEQARAELESLRRGVQLKWAQACTSAGVQLDDVAATLAARVAADPLDERAQALLIRALMGAERRVDALAQFDVVRRALAAELGVSPGAELIELHRRLLDDSPDLPPRPEPAAERSPDLDVEVSVRRGHGFRPRRMRVAAVFAVAALAVGVGLAVRQRGSPPKLASARGFAKRPLRAPIADHLRLLQPSCCAVTPDGVWGAGHHNSRLFRFSGDALRTVTTWPGLGFQSGLPVAAAGSIWIPAPAGPLVRFDLTRDKIVARIPVAGDQVAFGFLNIWETTREHQLVRIDLATNHIISTVRYDSGSNDWDDPLVIGPDAVWVSDADGATLLRIDPATMRVVARIGGFGNTDSAMPLAYGAGSVWVKRFVGDREILFQVNTSTNRIVDKIDVAALGASGLTGTVAVGGGFVWTGNWDDTLSQVDPSTGQVVHRYTLPSPPQNLVYTDGALWVDSYDGNVAWKIPLP